MNYEWWVLVGVIGGWLLLLWLVLGSILALVKWRLKRSMMRSLEKCGVIDPPGTADRLVDSIEKDQRQG